MTPKPVLTPMERLFEGCSPLDLTHEELKQVLDEMMINLDEWGGLPPPNYRFQLFSICVEFNSDKPGKLYGCVEVDASGSTDGFISLFNRGAGVSQPICNKGLVPIADSSAVLATNYVKIRSKLYVIHDDDDEEEGDDDDDDDDDNDNDDDDDDDYEEEGEVLNQLIYWDMAEHRVRVFDSCLELELKGKYGHSTLFYLISKRAVEATMKVSLITPDGDGRNVRGNIVAYYGNFDYDCRPHEREYYKVTLFESESVALSGTCEIPLKRSVMALPYKCSLIIEGRLFDESGEEIFNGLHEFPAQLKDSNSKCIKGNKGYRLVMKVDYEYETFAHDYDVL